MRKNCEDTIARYPVTNTHTRRINNILKALNLWRVGGDTPEGVGGYNLYFN